MRRSAALLVALLTAGASVPAGEAMEQGLPGGWQRGEWSGIRPARFEVARDGTIAVSSNGEGSFVWRRESHAAECLSWRWRVDEAPPPTRLDRRGGDDRALAITVGFAGWPPQASAWQRTQHSMAQARTGGRHLPRAALVFVWGGTGEEAPGFESPYMAGLGRVFVLRPATAPRGVWQEERVNLGARWREAFGGYAPPVEKLVVSVDSDDTRARIEARVESLRFGPCPQRS
jgi:hypothetical protein